MMLLRVGLVGENGGPPPEKIVSPAVFHLGIVYNTRSAWGKQQKEPAMRYASFDSRDVALGYWLGGVTGLVGVAGVIVWWLVVGTPGTWIIIAMLMGLARAAATSFAFSRAIDGTIDVLERRGNLRMVLVKHPRDSKIVHVQQAARWDLPVPRHPR
jgi:hypothetical protein